MKRKTIILFLSVVVVLATGIFAAALVLKNASHRRAANSSDAISQPLPAAPKPSAGLQADSTNMESEAPSLASSAGTMPVMASEQDPEPDDAPPSPPARKTAALRRDIKPLRAQAHQDSSAAPEAQPVVSAAIHGAPALHVFVPAGINLTVRLEEPLGSHISRIGQSFSATLDRDVIVNGQTVIGAGAPVKGKVVLAKSSGTVSDNASLQLKLTSIILDSGDLPIVTSVQSFGPNTRSKNKVGKFIKGLFKRAIGTEREVVLNDESAYSFILRRRLQIQ